MIYLWELIDIWLAARCKYMAKPPRNGMVIAPKTEHGMKARYKCKDGYTIRGEGTTTCLFGNWTGEPPYCQEGLFILHNKLYNLLDKN